MILYLPCIVINSNTLHQLTAWENIDNTETTGYLLGVSLLHDQ